MYSINKAIQCQTIYKTVFEIVLLVKQNTYKITPVIRINTCNVLTASQYYVLSSRRVKDLLNLASLSKSKSMHGM